MKDDIADIFMTWGWKIKENDKPSKAYRIEKFSRNFNYKNKKLFDLLLVYPSIYSVNEKRFKQISSLFFQNIIVINSPKYVPDPDLNQHLIEEEI